MQPLDPGAPPRRGGLVGWRSAAAAGVGGDPPSPRGVAVLAPYLERPLLVRKLRGGVRDRRVLAVAGGGHGWCCCGRSGRGRQGGEKEAMMGGKCKNVLRSIYRRMMLETAT